MEPMELKFVELHSPMFLSKTNLGLKLDPGKRQGMRLEYHREHQELHVHLNDQMAIVPLTNVVSMAPGKPERPLAQFTHPMVVNIGSAQVETPQGHVHAGPGKGKR